MSDWQRAQVEINQHQISYLRTGGDKPPIILLHDFSEDRSTGSDITGNQYTSKYYAGVGERRVC